MKYFTINEMCRSSTAKECRIKNEPSPEAVANLEALIENVLDPARERYGKPIRVSSGYRCPELNKQVGGDEKSQHLCGQAADLKGSNCHENHKIGMILIELGNFDQLIFEQVTPGTLDPIWIHVSYRTDGKNRHQILKTRLGHTEYEEVKIN